MLTAILMQHAATFHKMVGVKRENYQLSIYRAYLPMDVTIPLTK
jgi:hypothetical protein